MRKVLLHPLRISVFALLLGACVVGATSRAQAACGDAVVDVEEQCDGGPCCNVDCTFAAAGQACPSDGLACTADRCDAAGTCTHAAAPLNTCLVAPKGKLQIANDTDDAKDKLILQMQNAPGVSPADFGDPTTSDAYHACLFGPDELLLEAAVAPGGLCDGKPCWAETTAGFTYKDKTGSQDGVTLLALKASAKPKTKIDAKAKGAGMPNAPLPFPDGVMAQIVNEQTGQCFETYFLEPSAVKKNTPTQYDAKAAAPGFEIPGLADVIRQDDPATAPPPPDQGGPRVGPDPTKVYVQSITYAGTGCPDGTASVALDAERDQLSLDFQDFVATKGPGSSPADANKSCQVNLNLHIPQGWQYSIATIEYRGLVQLPKKMKASQTATYYFQGDGNFASADSSYAGPVSRTYLIRDTLPFSTVAWSSCATARPLNITTELQLKGGTDPGQITTDSIDGRLNFVLGLRWKPC
jgi:hypothetical protein